MTDTRTKRKAKLLKKFQKNKIKLGEYIELLRLLAEDDKLIRKAQTELGNIKEGNK